MNEKSLIERLRMKPLCREVDGVSIEYHPTGPWDDLLQEAADEIERLQERIEWIQSDAEDRRFD